MRPLSYLPRPDLRFAVVPKRLLSAAFALLALVPSAPAAPNGGTGDAARNAPAIGASIAPFSLRDTAGTLVHVAPGEAAEGGVRAVVLAFSGVGCPIAEGYAPLLEELSQSYGSRGVRFFAINSNVQDALPELRAFVNEFGLTFPLLKDHGHAIADQLGAERTTEVFLLDQDFKLRYQGRIDDQFSVTGRSVGFRKDHAEKRFLRNAIDALLAGNSVATPRTQAQGCIIGRKPKALTDKILTDKAHTYHEHVERILQARCQSCHREGQIAPFPLLSYDDALGWSGMIAEVVENRRMPPWHADDAHGKFSNDRSLSQNERQTLLAWVAAGAPRGDPSQAPPPRSFPAGWQIEPDVVFEMPQAFEVPSSGTIDYQYFKVATEFSDERWVKSIEVQPGARDVVHHILVFAVDPADPKAWRRETRGGAGGYFGAMVPGERPLEFPPHTAKRLPAGATLIFQVHYTANGTPQTDRSRLGLVFADTPPKYRVRTGSAFNDRRLHVPAGAEAHAAKAFYEFQNDTELLSLLPHMHIRGKAFRYEAHYPTRVQLSRRVPRAAFPRELRKRMRYDDATKTLLWRGALSEDSLARLKQRYTSDEDRQALAKLRRDGRSETLLNVPAYDFGWQSTYHLATPKRLPGGTVIECTAVFNNSASNPALTRDLWSQPVTWGDQTWDEMLIGYFDAIDLE